MNKYAWKPKANVKINESEVGSKQRPYSEITGVCPRCRDQIDWKRRYGKYKPLVEPGKCQKCSKRNVRQAHHKICLDCSKSNGVCAKCCCQVAKTVGRDISEIEAERKALDEAIKNARERERRTLLRAMNKAKANTDDDEGEARSKICDRSREGNIFSAKTVDEYAQNIRGEHHGDEDLLCK